MSTSLHDELVGRAAALRGQLQQDAADHDRDRRLTDRTVTALRDNGMLRLLVPKALGGHQVGMRTFVDVTAELGRGCTSTAWVTAVVNTGNFLIGLFTERARKEVWSDNPSACAAGILAPTATVEPVAGGIKVSGKWPYASGSQICDWAVVGVPHGEVSLALLPMSELTVEDTWHVMGMRGTASNTIVAQGVFVPDHRLLPLGPVMGGANATEFPSEPLYRTSVTGVLLLSLLGAQLGTAVTARDFVVEKAPKRAISTTSYPAQTQSVAFQMDVAHATAKIDTAHLHVHRIAEMLDDHARRGVLPDLTTRSRTRMDAAYASLQVKEAVDLLVSAHGTASFADFSPLQRIFRDVNVASRHAGTGIRIPQEIYGRALLGLDPYVVSTLI
ncbi:acyl-CoA dehydrogenase family protein [Kibdelosporangium philippinense]|uniref:Acyl-CoA dehydrogenase family protein n=1 Tax=Kibdelosporangium philippinense TaxID=211113 RepID=A0ABS8Z8T3_9PSEU|nr:acyl-CoA dehydrogenase family protein [Kibdelosporangium philippinense]MCE7002262.1 acyl-CoA dehydrogenase family protein [Kibdelosporangium philippinense]